MKTIALFLTLCSTVCGQNIAAKLPSELDSSVLRIGRMDYGQHIQVYADALVVDDDGRTWLNPRYISLPPNVKGDVEVIHNKLGYIARVNYRYVQTEHGYSVPKWPTWNKRSWVPPYYIPIKAVTVEKPIYNELSPVRDRSLKLQKQYNPKFEKFPNPYSLESKNARSNVRGPVPSSTNSQSSDFILPELFDPKFAK